MNENLKLFFEEVAKSEELQSKLVHAANADEAYAIASETTPGFSKEEFVEAMIELRDEQSDLSVDDLEKVAGGSDDGTIFALGLALAALWLID